ncbi:MAG: hypothetical protein ACRDPR_15260, partial [Nocardioidaceae bacterium]
RWPLAALAAVAVALLLPGVAWAPTYMGGPSVRVTPNAQVEFKWRTDVTWFGEVAVFDNPDGTGTPFFVSRDEDALGNPVAATEHVVTVDLPPLAAETTYYLRVTATDPTGGVPPFSTPKPLPRFFTARRRLATSRSRRASTAPRSPGRGT